MTTPPPRPAPPTTREPRLSDVSQCQGRIWKPEQYRRTGAGKNGFKMHYVRCQCMRMVRDEKYCWQHREQGDYERELESAYAQHTAIY